MKPLSTEKLNEINKFLLDTSSAPYGIDTEEMGALVLAALKFNEEVEYHKNELKTWQERLKVADDNEYKELQELSGRWINYHNSRLSILTH